MEINHKCIKCSKPYKDLDVEDYYCATCLAEKKSIAAEVDKKMRQRPSERAHKSDLQVYDELAQARGSKFVKMSDLGIKW